MKPTQGIGKAAYEAFVRTHGLSPRIICEIRWQNLTPKYQLAWVRAAQAAIKAAKK